MIEEIGAFVGVFIGAAVGMSLGVEAALIVRGWQSWQLFAMGFGTAAIFALAGGAVGNVVGKTAVSRPQTQGAAGPGQAHEPDATRRNVLYPPGR